jgi:cation diffusion facilitator CzcD-associated flavoprotein CzcO
MRFASTFNDIIADPDANAAAAEFAKRSIRARVTDPDLAQKLLPDYFITTRRLCIDTGYYESFNRPNVTLIDLREEPLTGITPTGFTTSAGEHEIDVLILATGFDAVTGTLRRIDITGRNGVKLADKWGASPAAYLGITVAGFPNMFVATGPGSPSALSNVVLSIEQHVEWITTMLADLRARGITVFEPTAEAEADWVAHVAAVSDSTLLRYADSWYTGTNIEGKPRVNVIYLGGVGPYETLLKEIAADGYRGFALTS